MEDPVADIENVIREAEDKNEQPNFRCLDEKSVHLSESSNSRYTNVGTSTFTPYDHSASIPHDHLKSKRLTPAEVHSNYLIYDTSRQGAHQEAHYAATTWHSPSHHYSTWGRERHHMGPPRRYDTMRAKSIPLSQLYQYLSSSVPRYRTGADGTLQLEQKETSIAFFDIETDRVSSFQYRPDEHILGTINLFVKSSVSIRYVELIVEGSGVISVKRTPNDPPVISKETYLYKKKCVLGSKDSHYNIVLPRGHYATKFRIHLPKDLPSTIHYEDVTNGFLCDVTYTILARICDSSRYLKGNSSHSVPKVLIFKQIPFNVQRSFDVAKIPEGIKPVMHTEQIGLSYCQSKRAVVTVNLERSVYLAGDDVRLHINATLPKQHTIKKITCLFQEQITFAAKQEPVTITLFRVESRDELGTTKTDEGYSSNFVIPTSVRLVSPFSLSPSQIKLRYFLDIKLLFGPTAGKLSFKIPLVIGPCADPIYGEKTSSGKVLPIFNKPTRFPTFSSPFGNGHLTKPDEQVAVINNNKKCKRVEAKYENGFLSYFSCCFIHD